MSQKQGSTSKKNENLKIKTQTTEEKHKLIIKKRNTMYVFLAMSESLLTFFFKNIPTKKSEKIQFPLVYTHQACKLKRRTRLRCNVHKLREH